MNRQFPSILHLKSQIRYILKTLNLLFKRLNQISNVQLKSFLKFQEPAKQENLILNLRPKRTYGNDLIDIHLFINNYDVSLII